MKIKILALFTHTGGIKNCRFKFEVNLFELQFSKFIFLSFRNPTLIFSISSNRCCFSTDFVICLLSVEFMYLDLASLTSVRQFVQRYKATGLPLHVLVNNGMYISEFLLTLGNFPTVNASLDYSNCAVIVLVYCACILIFCHICHICSV